jgi:hypothetical protein
MPQSVELNIQSILGTQSAAVGAASKNEQIFRSDDQWTVSGKSKCLCTAGDKYETIEILPRSNGRELQTLEGRWSK